MTADPFDAVLDARSEARYEDDPSAEPDTREVADTLARMGLEATERGAAGLMFRRPFPKSQQLARGERRYRRKVASAKQWQAIIAAKRGPCRVCEVMVPHPFEGVEYHHLVARAHGGDDTADNIVPLCSEHHGDVTKRHAGTARILLAGLSDAEYAYAIQQGGEDYFERAYGVSYGR